MSDFSENFSDPARVRNYLENGPPAFTPGHSGLLQVVGVLLAESVPEHGSVLVLGAGGGLETRYLSDVEPSWRFVGVDPASEMLELAREVVGVKPDGQLEWIEGTVDDSPMGPFDAATCILVLGVIPDDGCKLATLKSLHSRLKPSAPLVVVDQCIDRADPDFELRLDRYAQYARRSGVPEKTVEGAREAIRNLPSMVSADRNEQLLFEAGFDKLEVFYVGMAWRGWIAYAGVN